MRAVRRGHAQCQPRARALRATALPATALRAAAVEAPGDAAAAATGPEALMDAKLAGLGVSWYQALMVLFVASVYAADGAEVTVMSLVSRSLAEKYSLVSWQKGLLGMSVYSGMFAGGLVAGPVADSKGRSFTIVSATALISVFGVLSAYAPTFSLLCAARFVAGLGMGASLPVASSLLQETVPKKWKGGLACLVFAGFNSGEYFAARAGKVAVGRADPATWLFLVAALPALLTFAAALIVPESPRFLAGRGNAKSVASWFKTAARVNGKKTEELFPEGLEAASNALVAEAAEGKKGGGAGIRSKLDGIFRGALKKRTLCLWLLWCSANAAFYGMIFSLPEALQFVKAQSGDAAFDVAAGISKVSAYQTLAFLLYMPLVGLGVSYKKLFPVTFLGAFISLGAAFAGGTPSPERMVACLACAKFFYNGIFMMLYPLTGESYPTAVRATGVALAGTVGRICTILVAPVCTRLQEVAPLLPYNIFVAVSAVACLVSLLL